MNLPPNIAAWPWKWRERYEERAAIFEFDGLMSKGQAELLAESEVRRQADETKKERVSA